MKTLVEPTYIFSLNYFWKKLIPKQLLLKEYQQLL